MWVCSDGSRCLCTGREYSAREARELSYLCSCYMATRLVKVIGGIAPTTPKNQKAKRPKLSKRRVVVAPLLKQRCSVVVKVGEPANLEFVYPPLVDSSVAIPQKKVQEPTVVPDVRVPVSMAPKWMVAVPHPPVKPLQKAPRLRFPRGAVVFNGINFLDKRGRIVLSKGAKKILATCAKRARQARRAARRQAICRKIRMARLSALYREVTSSCTWEPIHDGFSVAVPAGTACLPRTKREALPLATQGKLKKKSRRSATPPTPAVQDFSCIDTFEWGDAHSIPLEDEWVMVEKPVLRRRAAATPQGRASEALIIFAATSGISQLAHQRVETFACTDGASKVIAGKFADLFLQSLVYNEVGTLSGTTEQLVCKQDFLDAIDLLTLELGEIPVASEARAPWNAFAGSVKKMASGVGNMVGNFARASGAAGLIAWDKTIDYLQDKALSFCKKVFDATMAPYLAHLAEAGDLIRRIWRKLSEWVGSLRSKAGLALDVLAEHAVFALSGIIIGGVVVLVERVLVAAKIIPTCGIVLGAFLTLFFASLGLTALQCTADEIFKMHSCCKTAVYQMYAVKEPVYEGENVTEARGALGLDTAIATMSRIGQSMINLKLGSFSYYAKIAQGFDQLARGKRAIGELTSWLIDLIGSIYAKVSGKESTFFDELSSIVCVDVRSWILKSKGVRQQAETMAIGDRLVLDTLSKLLEDGKKILVTAAGQPRKTSMDFTMIIKEEVAKLEEVYQRSACAGENEGSRIFPFWVYVFGASQSGKTSVANSLFIPELLDELKLPKSSVYSRPKTGGFWSGYARQACVKVDDLYAIEQTPSLAACMIDVVNSEPFPLDMAYLHEKGMMMDSPLVVTTANTIAPPTKAGITDLPSFYNRRAAVIEVRRKDNTRYTPRNYDGCVEVRFFHPKVPYLDSNGIPIGPAENTPVDDKWITPSEAVCELKNKLGEHMFDEEDRMADHRSKRGMDHPIYNAAQQFIGDLKFPGKWLSLEDKIKYGIADGEFSYLAVDGKMYKYDMLGKLHECSSTPKHPNVIPWLEKCTLDYVHWDVHKQLSIGPRNALVACFLQGLVQERSHVDSVYSMGMDSSPEQQDFFRRLTLSEKIYLRLCQIRIDNLKNEELSATGLSVTERLKKCLVKSKCFLTENYSLLLTLVSILVIIAVAYTLLSSVIALAGCTSFAGGMVAMTTVSNATMPCSEPRLEERFNPRNRFVSRITKARGEGPDKGQGDHEELVVELYYCCDGEKRLISCCWFKGRSLLMTRHQAMAVPVGSEVEAIYADDTRKKLIWPGLQENGSGKGYIEFPENELVVFEHPSLLTQPIRYEKYFVDDPDRQVSPNVAVKCCVVRLEKGIPAFHFWNKYATARDVVTSVVGAGGAYQNHIRRHIIYSHDALMNDCGALAVAKIGGIERVIAMLVSGSGPVTYCSIIPNYSSTYVRGQVPYVPEGGVTENGYRKVGYLHKADAPHVPSKTSFMEVPQELQIPFPNPKQPSILSSEDPRLKNTIHEGYSPLKDGMRKFAEPMSVLDPILLDEVCGDMVQTWYDANDELESVTLHEAINGDVELEYFDPIVLDTSEGYPEVLHRVNGEKNKHRFFVGEPGNREFVKGCGPEKAYYELAEMCKSKVPPLVAIETPKDERLKKSKIETPGTRLFSVLGLHYNLFMRVLYLPFIRHLMVKREFLPCQVGINPYSRSWSDLYHRLASTNDVGYNCDYKGFDGLMTAQILEVIADAINVGFKDVVGNKQRKNMLLAISSRLSICGNQVYEVTAGIPSGCALTVILNSIFNEILMRYCFKKIVPPIYRESFNRYVTIVTYGDDNLFTVAYEVVDTFTGNALKAEMAKIGVTITDGKDKSLKTLDARPLLELEFLKRGFKKGRGGMILAPLEKLSIMSSLIYIRSDGSDMLQKLVDNVVTALLELYLHQDREEFESVRNFYAARLPPDTMKKILTWYEAETFHECQLADVSAGKPRGLLEVSHGANLAAFARNEGSARAKHLICKNLWIAGELYNGNEGEILISLSSRLPGDVECVKLDLPCGDGIGRLPSRQAILNLRKPGVLMNACHRSRKENVPLVIRDERPYVGGWAVAAICGETMGFSIDSTLCLYANLLGQQYRNGLASYFANESAPVHIKQVNATTNCDVGKEAVEEVFQFAKVCVIPSTHSDVRSNMCAMRVDQYPHVAVSCGISFSREGDLPGTSYTENDISGASGKVGVFTSCVTLRCCKRCHGVSATTNLGTNIFGTSMKKATLRSLRKVQTHECKRK
uniref:RNA1 polyprotein n=1 Tax=Beetleweed nepovirus TaxID=3115756 RepID=A0AAT9J7U0_9SECO